MIRNSFVKLVPRRFTPDSETVSIGSNQYTTQWVDVEPEAVYQDRGGIEPVSLSFSWNDTTKTTTFTTTSAPDENIFIDYPIRFCGEVVTYIQDDPVTPSGSVVRWEPRLSGNPSIPESASNMLNGVLSTTSTSISIDNNDYELNKYLTKYDNYKNRSAVIYGQLGDSYKNITFGYITTVKAGKKITVSIKASTKLFESTATLGNSEQYYQYNKADYPSLDNKFDGKPIPVCYGYLSQIPKPGSMLYATTSSTTANKRYELDREFIEMAYIGSQTFICGVVDNPWSRTSYETIDLTYVGSETYIGETVFRFDFDTAKDSAYFIEGELALGNRSGGAGTKACYIEFVDYENDQILLSGSSLTDIESIVIAAVSVFRPSYNNANVIATPYLVGMSYSIYATAGVEGDFTFEATESGQYLVKYEYKGSFWNDFKDSPWQCVLRSKPRTQSSFLQKYIESTGLSVDATSFSQAQTDANANVMMTVNRGTLQNIHEVVESVATSCNGILYFDSSNEEYKYKIVTSSLAGTDWTIDLSDILEPELVPIISYGDTASLVNMKHPYTDERLYIDDINSSRDTSFSRAFNSESRSKQLEHFLTDSSDVIDLKSETFNTPMVTYRFTVMADEFFDVDIGDIVEIENTDGRILNAADSVRLLIVARTRSVEKIGLTGYEFEKIP
jgi:hypothetical protein